MSFFGRAANLVKGGLKSLTDPSDPGRAARDRALEEELARAGHQQQAGHTPERAPRGERTAPSTPAERAAPAAPERAAPERDEHGNVKRTL